MARLPEEGFVGAGIGFPMRLDAAGRPRVLEINALPGMSPGWSDLTLEAASVGIDYDALALGILEAAGTRLRLTP